MQIQTLTPCLMWKESIDRVFRKKLVRSLVFVLVLLSISLYYNYFEILTYRPISKHQWRNCVSASIALNYYHEGEFFLPRTHNMQVDNYTSDITITEFPLIYYFIGILYRIFGYHEAIYKLVNVLIGFTGLYFLFLTGLRAFNKTIYALVPPVVLFSAPIYVYYTNNFIPDATSLSIVLAGFYFFYRYYEDKRGKDMLWTLVFFGLAGLIKAPAFLLFFAVIGVFGLEWIFRVRFKETGKVFPNPWKQVIWFIAVLAAAFAWYAYAKIYTDRHGGVVSLVEIRPIWILSAETIKDTLLAVSVMFRTGNYHYRFLLIAAALLFILNLVLWRKHNRLFSWLVLLTFTGGASFSLLFFRSLRLHDYYQLNNLIIVVLILVNFFLFIREQQTRIFNSWITKSATLALLLFLVIKCNTFLEKQYYGGWFWDYSIEHYNNRYGEITPYLRSLGIEREDKVYCTYDPSINISLYLMDQKGFTDFYQRVRPFSEKVEFFGQKGMKYVLVGDYDTIDKDPEEIGLVKIGEYNGVGIYRF